MEPDVGAIGIRSSLRWPRRTRRAAELASAQLSADAVDAMPNAEAETDDETRTGPPAHRWRSRRAARRGKHQELSPGEQHQRRVIRRIALLVGLTYYLGSFIVFRHVITAIPGVLSGEWVIGGDELVPFWNPHSQLLDQAKGEYSDLTNGFEFRVRYSFLTTWIRHYQVLPFAILLFLPFIVWCAYLCGAWFIAKVFRSLSPVTVYLVTSIPTALIYMIMIYAKVTHFYTLVFGLMLMMISSMTMLYALIFQETRWVRTMAFSCFVTLMNPAVHYLILFALFLSLTVATLLLGEFARWWRRGGPLRLLRWRPMPLIRSCLRPKRIRRVIGRIRRLLGTTVGRCATSFTILVWVALVPYALFVKFVALRGVPNLSETVPGDYYFIRDASVSLFHILSWDLAGIMDKVQFGDYLAKRPRVGNMVYTLLLIVPFAVPAIRRPLFPTRPHRQLFGVFAVNIVFAMWATVGYGEPGWLPTFHRSLASLTRTLYSTETPVGSLTLAVSSTIVQVLRFPHRFQLILFMLAPVVLTLPLAWLVDRLHGRHVERQAVPGATRQHGEWVVTRLAMTTAIAAVFFVPFFGSEPYRNVYGSGNFSNFLTPYPTSDLHDAKQAILDLPRGKVVVLPPTETAKMVVDDNGVAHKYIDKFHIYYLDSPSFYYGLTGDSSNKFEFFLILRGLYYQQDWWINVARDIGLDYIVLNKEVENNRGIGAEYLPELELFLRTQLEALPDHLAVEYENDSFIVYRLIDRAPPKRQPLLIDASWRKFLDTVFQRLELSGCYDFQYVSNVDLEASGTLDGKAMLLTSNVEEAAIDLWALSNPGSFARPSTKIFAFNPDIVASSYYLSPMFRQYLFFSNTKWNRTEMITPGMFGTLRGSFIGVPRATQFTIPVVVTEPARYRVLMRTAATANSLHVREPVSGFDQTFELRSPREALQVYDVDTIYETNRVAVDAASMSVDELEDRLGDDLVPVNLRYAYQDLGTVDLTAGLKEFKIDKLDSNPMLVEGLVLMPETEFQTLTLPANVDVVEDPSDLRCSDTTPARQGLSDGAAPAVENGPHADLTSEQMLDLIGVEYQTADPNGLGGRLIHLAFTVLLLAASISVIRWRTRVTGDD